MRRILFILACLTISNCSTNEAKDKSTNETHPNRSNIETIPSSNSLVDRRITLKNKRQEIAKLIGKRCETSSQCKVIGVGVSPCGGYASYSVYSEEDTNTKALKQSVNQFNQIMKALNQKNNVVGICRHIEAPKVFCQLNQCASLNTSLSL